MKYFQTLKKKLKIIAENDNFRKELEHIDFEEEEEDCVIKYAYDICLKEEKISQKEKEEFSYSGRNVPINHNTIHTLNFYLR